MPKHEPEVVDRMSDAQITSDAAWLLIATYDEWLAHTKINGLPIAECSKEQVLSTLFISLKALATQVLGVSATNTETPIAKVNPDGSIERTGK